MIELKMDMVIAQRKKIENVIQNEKSHIVVQALLCVFVFLCFFEQYINLVVGSLTKYYVFFVVLVLIVTYRKFYFKAYHLFFLVWFLYKLLSAFWTPNLAVFNNHLLSHFGMTLIFVVLTAVNIDKKTIKAMTYALLFSSFLMGFLSIFFSKGYENYDESRQVLTLFGAQNDPNNQAAFLLFGIAISLFLIMYERKLIIPSLAVIAVNAYSLFLTGSRGGLLGLLCILALCVFISKKRFSVLNFVIRLLIISAVVGACYFIATKLLPAKTFERLFDSDYADGSGRFQIWNNAFTLLNQNLNWFFGGGWGSLYGYNDVYMAGHNTYISMLCDVGIIGFVLFFAPIAYIIFYFIKEKQILPLFLLVSGLTPCFFLDAINKRFFWLPIILAFVIYNLTKKDKTPGRR